MMEPWQEGRPEPSEWLGTRFVCRVSGAPADTVDDLRARATLDRLQRLHQVDAELAGRRERLSQVLFNAIGAASEKPQRNKLITLKRELYNLRPGSTARVPDAVGGLPAGDADEVRGFAALLDERVALEAAIREAYAAETPELRARFRRLLDDADFRKGLMISSRALYGAVDRWGQAAAGGKAELGGKDEKTERGLLRYYTRMAMKATPFSTFCAILPGEFVEDGGGAGDGLIRFHGDPRQKRSYVRINKFIYGLLYDHLRTRKPVRRALQVELNPTLREEGGRLVFLTAIDAREVFQRLANNEVLELITSRFQGLGKPTLGDLIGALCADPQIEATEEEAEAYLDKLIEIGFLRFHTGVGEQDADWDLPFRALLDSIDDDHARQSSALLAKLREVVEAYTDADVAERARMIDEMHTLLTEAIESMDIQQRLRRDMPFYEDATSPARAEVALTPAVRRTFRNWADWARATSRVAWPRGEQATMRHFFDTYYHDERPRVPLLVFYEDFYREHFKAHVEKEGKMRAGVQDDSLKGYDVANPFGLEFVKRMYDSRDRLGEIIRERWQAAPGADEIALTAADVGEALQNVENTSTVCRSMGSFACLAPAGQPGGDPLLILGGGSYTTGFGKYFSRFLYMLPDDVQEQVRRENASMTGELLAEICGDAQFNANLHPPLLRWEISYPTGESGNAEQQIKSGDIFIERDPEDANALRLVHGPTGHRVIPVDLGFLNPRMRPPLYQLISRFTPPAMFGPPVPESPERRPRPAPPAPEGEADAQAKGDDPQPDPQAAPSPEGQVKAGDPQPDPQAAPSPEGQAKGDDPQPDPQAAPAAEGQEGAPPPAHVPPPPRIQVRPRVSYEGTLVIARKRWQVPGPLFPQREPHESAADFFLRANRWRVEAGIPETVYVRINPLPEPQAGKPGQPAADAAAEAEAQQQAAAAAGEVPGYDAPVAEEAGEHEAEADDGAEAAAEGEAPAEGAAGADGEKKPQKPRTAGSRDLHKPQFIDFGNPLLVGLLGKMGANLKTYNATFEERLPGREALPRGGSEAYASEIVVQLYFPAGTAGSFGHALAGEEEHAAAVA